MTPWRGAAGIVCAGATLLCPGASEAQGNLDAKAQCLAAADEGQNQRDAGQYRAARASFLTCSSATCPTIVAGSCMRWLREVDEDAPTVVLGARDPTGMDLTDVRVSFDGRLFATQLDGRPLQADAGEHVFRFERPGAPAVETSLMLRAGEKARVVTVTLASATSAMPDPRNPSTPGEPTKDTSSSRRVVTVAPIALAAITAAGIATFFVIESNQQRDDASALRGNGGASNACTGGAAMTPNCQLLGDKVSAQHRDVNLATGLFVGAGALAAGAALLWTLWPDHSDHGAAAKQTAWIEPREGGASLCVAGRFE
jgi:hypothetical protein